MAGLITQPAQISVAQEYTTDRDEDGDVDTVEATVEVTSSAFYEVLDIEVRAFEENTLHDSLSFSLEAGNSVPVNQTVWFIHLGMVIGRSVLPCEIRLVKS